MEKNTVNHNTDAKATRIYNLIILDESGSMGSIRAAALDGANETINSIKGAQFKYPEQIQYLTFVTFDEGSKPQNVRFVIDTKHITEVDNITEKDYRPDGLTPLLDAIGISLTKLEQQVSEDDNVLVTIITDGMENASKEYKDAQIKAMIEQLKSRGWTFVFIGANMDSVKVATTLNIDNALNFKADEKGFQCMTQTVSSSRERYYLKVRMSKVNGEKSFSDTDFFDGGTPKS